MGTARGAVITLLGVFAIGTLGAGCTTGGVEESRSATSPPPATPTTPAPTGADPSDDQPADQPDDPARARVRPADVRPATAMRVVRHLAEQIGPRTGASPAFAKAAAWVGAELEGLGFEVRQQRFEVPEGRSVAGPTAGLRVPGGRSANVIATRGDVVAGQPWLVVGAHLDTVPTSPGAEDNASGVGALLAVAEAIAERRTRLPVVLVAFGSEEPRGPSDDEHHYGSRAYVASLSPAERRSLRGMVALDRVGVGTVTPVGSVAADDPLRDELERAARRARVPVVLESQSRSSDHWSFVRDGLPGARLGSTPYAGYHSPGDTTAAIEREQLARAARIVVSWLR